LRNQFRHVSMQPPRLNQSCLLTAVDKCGATCKWVSAVRYVTGEARSIAHDIESVLTANSRRLKKRPALLAHAVGCGRVCHRVPLPYLFVVNPTPQIRQYPAYFRALAYVSPEVPVAYLGEPYSLCSLVSSARRHGRIERGRAHHHGTT